MPDGARNICCQCTKRQGKAPRASIRVRRLRSRRTKRRLHAAAAALYCDGFKLLVQRQLRGQRVAQLGIVIDDEKYLTPVRHRSGSRRRGFDTTLPRRFARSRTCEDKREQAGVGPRARPGAADIAHQHSHSARPGSWESSQDRFSSSGSLATLAAMRRACCSRFQTRASTASPAQPPVFKIQSFNKIMQK